MQGIMNLRAPKVSYLGPLGGFAINDCGPISLFTMSPYPVPFRTCKGNLSQRMCCYHLLFEVVNIENAGWDGPHMSGWGCFNCLFGPCALHNSRAGSATAPEDEKFFPTTGGGRVLDKDIRLGCKPDSSSES